MTGDLGPDRWDAERQEWVTGVAPRPPRRSRRVGRPALVVLAVLVCCALAGGGWALFGTGGGHHGRTVDATSSSPTSSTQSPATSPTGDPSPSVSSSPGSPPGYTARHDSRGFTVDVPEGWTRSEESRDDGVQVFYTSDDQRSLIQIGVVPDQAATPYDAFTATEDSLRGRAGYTLDHLTRLDDTSDGPVELEYSYRNDQFGPRRVIDRGFTGPDGTFYAILVGGPPADWEHLLTVYNTATGSFCATGDCDG